LELAARPEGTSAYREPLLRKVYEASSAASSVTPGAIVEALSSGLETIAADLASDISKLDVSRIKREEP
jgi:hypothetical protein